MNKKILICFLLICTMLVQLLPASMAAEAVSVDFSNIVTVSDISVMEGNKLPDGIEINPAEHTIYLKGGFRDGCQHVASRTFTLSNIVDTDLIGCDLIGYGHDTYKDDTVVRKYFKTNHDVNGTPGLLNWINFTVEFDADVYVYTLLGKGGQPDNDRALEAAGFTFVGTNSNGFMKSSVAINNCTFKGKWEKSVTAGTRVSLPSYRGGSNAGSIMPVAIIDYNLKEITWPAASSHGRDMPFTPADKYVSWQNPPTYKWKYISNAKFYELQVATDSEFTNIVKKYENISTNYFSAPDTLIPGETYYWRVRYFTGSGVSKWTEGRRFRISPDAYEFTFPGVDEVMKRIPTTHPRILTTPDTVEDFRNLSETEAVSERVKNYYISLADGYVTEYAKGEAGKYSLIEPPYEDDGRDNYGGHYRSIAQTAVEHLYRTSFAYLLTGEEKYAQLAKKMILALSTWCMKDDGNGNLVYDNKGHTSYENQDQVHRYITYRSAMAYDWIADTLTAEEKAKVLNMIDQRTKRMEYLLSNLKSNPYDSHGWTAFGFIGIIGIATYGELESAEGWLRTVIPAYTSLLPPWGYQDGGWSQGTDYWQYSTNDSREFLDVLAQAEIIDLYKTAWMRNEYLWSLYAYPPNSYGSFGDQSNRSKSGYYSVGSLTNEAHYNQNPVSKWLVAQFGGTSSNNIDNYYTANLESLEIEEPTNYPLSHEFEDIGWVIMTNDLVDSQKIHMTFKSSPYGSFNHSHPDQNAFVIQAYGENLANKSGYYDWYHSTHDNHITRPTFAHNTITVDGGKGQRDDDFTAKGQMNHFVNHFRFDSATGDATAAYKGTTGLSAANYYKGIGNLDKFVRDIIYVRPGVFVVVDDLVAADGGRSSFEWWLNAEHTIDYSDKGAVINENGACLTANVVYPTNTRARYYDGFYSPYTDSYFTNDYFPAEAGYVDANEQRRVCFYTPEVKETRMVVTISVHKEDEAAEVISTLYSSDGSYVELTFADGTKCVINLGNDEREVSNGTVTFTGDAVTYTEDSILLTNGTKLSYKGREIVSSPNRAVTLAMGLGQLTFSFTGDSDNYVQNELVVANNTDFMRVPYIEDIRDSEGRTPSYDIGLPESSLDEEAITLYPYQGNYSLYTDDAVVNPAHMKPQNVRIDDIEADSFKVYWDEKSSLDYEIVINGTTYEGVNSPYTVNISPDEKTYEAYVVASRGSVKSYASSSVYYSPNAKATCSFVRYTDDENTITAEVFTSNPGMKKLKFIIVTYGADGNVLSTADMVEHNSIYKSTVSKVDGAKYVTYTWLEEGLVPLASKAEYDFDTTGLKYILCDGEPIADYSHTKDEYTVLVPEGTEYFPVLTAGATDNSTKVSVSHDYANLVSTINICSQEGNKRVIKVNYKLENSNVHVVAGADKEEDFKYDASRSLGADGNREGKVSVNNVATLTWDIVNAETSKPQTLALPVYTNLSSATTPTTFGSRLTSDREPISGNYTEFYNPAKSLVGYDHILMPNNDFFAMQGSNVGSAVKNAKLTFSLSKPAEILVLTTDNYNTKSRMLEQGFSFDGTQPISNGRYMDAIGVEDVYYNVNLLGKPKEALTSYNLTSTSGPRFKNYSYGADWVDVKPISGCTTVQSYIDKGCKESDFTIVGTCEVRYVTRTYYYKSAYIKEFGDITETTEVTIDFGDFTGEANRCVVVVRPITSKPPVTDFRYLGPVEFESLDNNLTENCTDVAEDRNTLVSAYNTNSIFRKLENGAIAFADNTGYKINNINPIIGIEGALFVPPIHVFAESGVKKSWLRAYYYGLKVNEGYKYPGFVGDYKPLYSFKLERSADLYVITAGQKPAFIDETWQRVPLDKPAFTVSDNMFTYNEIYVKHVDVEPGLPVTVTMSTANTGSTNDGLYFTLIKPTN